MESDPDYVNRLISIHAPRVGSDRQFGICKST